MTREEAIVIMQNEQPHCGKRITFTEEERCEAYDMAIEAIQKQIPQQPTIENGFVKCPACELYIRFPIMDRYNNCPECGQALKWEGEE